MPKKPITGASLYSLYEDVNSDNGISIDPWDVIGSSERAIWNQMADRINRGEHA